MDLIRIKPYQTLLLMLPLVIGLARGCGAGEIPTGSVETEELQVGEVLEVANATKTFNAAADQSTETAIVSATETAASQPPNTETPDPSRISMIYRDGLDDCLTPDGQPTECIGFDIDRVVMGVIRNDGDLVIFNKEAAETGMVLPDSPISVPYPFIISGIIIQDFDPDASFICFNWADQQTATAPSNPIANALATCYNPRHEFLYVNNIDASRQQGVEADPEGTLVFIDPDIGITFVQELGRIHRQDPPPSINLLVVANDDPRFDVLRFELEDFGSPTF